MTTAPLDWMRCPSDSNGRSRAGAVLLLALLGVSGCMDSKPDEDTNQSTYEEGDDDDDGAGGDSDDAFEGDDPGECSDDADNDRDGLYDCDDPDCAGSPDCPADSGDPTSDDTGDSDTDEEFGFGADPDDDSEPAASTFWPEDYGVGTPLSSIDWREVDSGYVSSVKNQGSAGTCTLFAAAGVLESALMIQLGQSSEPDVSEQYMMDCSSVLDADGNNSGRTVDFLVSEGTVDETDAPYLAYEDSCAGYPAAEYTAVEAFRVTGRDDIRRALHFGPVLMSFDVYDDFKDYWYDRNEWAGRTDVPYEHESDATDTGSGHAVLAVGYDDDEQAYIVKNSWGTRGGDDGYFKMSYRESGLRTYAYLLNVGTSTQFTRGLDLLDYEDVGAPNLGIRSLLVSPSSPTAGDTATASAIVENSGSESSGAFTAALYLSADNVIDSADRELSREVLSSIAAGATGSYSSSVTIPASESGSMYLILEVDPDNDVIESAESNNTRSRSVTIIGSGAPDLSMGSTAVSSSSPSPGDTISVSGDIDNTGSAATGTYTVGTYLSSNATFDSGDTLLSSWSEASLSAGSSTTYNENVAIPSSSGGSYYLLVVADPAGATGDSSTSNNTSATSISVASASTIDLDPGTVSVSPSSTTAGGAVTVSGSISNNGTGASGSSTTAFYWSSSCSSSGGTLLASASLGSVSAGGSQSYSRSVTVPSSASSGYVVVVADSTGAIAESSETNNEACRAVTISTPTTIDLDPGTVSVSPSSTTGGSAVTVSGSISNTGTGASGSSTTAFYWNSSCSSSGGTLLASSSLGSVSAGGSRSYTRSVTVPSSASSGYVVVVADSANTIAESSETNNEACGAVTISTPTISSVSCTNYERGSSTTCTIRGTNFLTSGSPYVECLTATSSSVSSSTRATVSGTWSCSCSLGVQDVEYAHVSGSGSCGSGTRACSTTPSSTTIGDVEIDSVSPSTVWGGTTRAFTFQGCNLCTTSGTVYTHISNVTLNSPTCTTPSVGDQVTVSGAVQSSTGVKDCAIARAGSLSCSSGAKDCVTSCVTVN
jgi:subtilase family serine protease